MKPYAQLRNQLIALVCLSSLGIAINWIYEYQLFIPSSATNRSTFETLPPEIGGARYWGAGWPIKFFYETRITDQQLLQLKGAPKLNTLGINMCDLSGSDIADLVDSLPEIRNLHCDARTVARIKLKNLPNLESLFGVQILEVQPIEALHLEGLTSLQESFNLLRELFYLHIDNMPGINALRTCNPWPEKTVFRGVRDLRVFSAGGPNVNDSVIEELLNCANLETLTLAHTSVTPDMLAKLSQFTKLKYLALSGSKVDDNVVAALAGLKQLQTLRLEYTPITDQAMDVLMQFGQLTHLDIGNTQVTDVGLAKLAGNKKLERLGCAGLPLGENAQRALATLETLRALDLAGCNAQATTLAALHGLRDLRLLNLSSAEIHKRSLMELARQSPDLKFICDEANIDQEAVLQLASVDRVVSVWNQNWLLTGAMEVARDRDLIKAGATHMVQGRATTERPEVEPEMFATNWTPPAIGPEFDTSGMMSPAGIQDQMLQQQMGQPCIIMDGLTNDEPVMEPMLYQPMTLPEAIGYGLGQWFSELASRSTSNE